MSHSELSVWYVQYCYFARHRQSEPHELHVGRPVHRRRFALFGSSLPYREIQREHGRVQRNHPNPAKGRFTIEGTGTMTVTNSHGQTILTREIDGKETLELPQGMCFVKLGEATRKVLVK